MHAVADEPRVRRGVAGSLERGQRAEHLARARRGAGTPVCLCACAPAAARSTPAACSRAIP